MENSNLQRNIAAGFSGTTKSLHDHWRLFIAEGIVLIALGVAAMIVPLLASLTVAIFLGWLLLIGGGFSFAMTVLSRPAPGFWWSLLSAVAAIIAGTFLISWPMGGVVSLTLVLAVFLVTDGILMICLAIGYRRRLSQRWEWMLMNGLLDLTLAGFIVWALPESAAWVLGIIVGIDMLFGGFSLIVAALAARGNIQPLSSS